MKADFPPKKLSIKKPTQRMLYIDNPFQGEMGGDKNRSKFIWEAITDEFDVDLLILQHYKNPNYRYKEHTKQRNLYEILSRKSRWNKPSEILQFPHYEKKKFIKLLNKKRYDYIFIRFAAPSALADLAVKILPNVKIIIDIDMLMSRLTELSWKLDSTWENRYFYIQNKKFIRFEKKLFSKPYLFFFTNYLEMQIANENYQKRESKRKMCVVSNVMQANKYPIPKEKKNYILFFGTLNSVANTDAFIFLIDEIYPLIKFELEKENICIRIVGRDKTEIFEEKASGKKYVNIVGEVDDINKEIAEALFVILPIRIASGTRTRILEAASLKTAVISTSTGAEGLDFEKDEIVITDLAIKFAKEIIDLLKNRKLVKVLGDNIYKKSNEKYLDIKVAKKMIEEIKKWNPK